MISKDTRERSVMTTKPAVTAKTPKRSSINFFKRKNPDLRKITPRQWAQRIRRGLEKNAGPDLSWRGGRAD